MKTLDLDALFSSIRVTPHVGRAIVFFRKKKRMTQEDLAAAADVDLSAIKRLEKGRKKGGWVETVEDICRALGITMGQLFDRAQQIACKRMMRAVFVQFSKVASCFFALAAPP